MKYIEKAPEPEAFIQWKQQEQERIDRILTGDNPGQALWRFFPSSPPQYPEEGILYYSKKELTTYLLEEQGWICCYCNKTFADNAEFVDAESEVSQAEKPLDIEHVEPQSGPHKRPDLVLDYSNLAISCAGGRGKPRRVQTCNSRKAEEYIAIKPHDPKCEERIVFAMNGEAFAKDINDRDATQTIETLGLNNFQEERGTVIRAYIKKINPNMSYEEFKSSTRPMPLIDTQDASAIMEQLSRKNADGKYRPFCSAVVSVLKSLVNP